MLSRVWLASSPGDLDFDFGGSYVSCLVALSYATVLSAGVDASVVIVCACYFFFVYGTYFVCSDVISRVVSRTIVLVHRTGVRIVRLIEKARVTREKPTV